MHDNASRGSVMLAAIFVVALLSVMGLMLLFVSHSEVRMNQADQRSKQAFYLAEAGTERGREQLRLNLVAAADDALAPHVDIAAGANNAIDLDPASVRPQYSGSTLTGFTGTGDDVPLLATTGLGGGWYAVYLTNDPADGEANLADTNDLVMLTGLGVAANGSFEVAQAIVRPGTLFPPLPATITLLGPTPDIDDKGGKGWMDAECPKQTDYAPKGSKISVDGVLVKGSKIYRAYNGTDCAPYRKLNGLDGQYPKMDPIAGGGIPGLFVPTYGAVGAGAEVAVEDAWKGSKVDYLSDLYTRTQVVRPSVPVGGYQGDDTVADLTDPAEPTVLGSGLGSLDPFWTNCLGIKTAVEKIRDYADYLCTPPGCVLPGTAPESVTFIDGDFRIPCGHEGYGLLVVTGMLDFPGSASWHGIVFVIGEGVFYRVKKLGYGNVTGGIVVADIAGPDNAYGTADDCTGGTGGFGSVTFDEGKNKEYKGNNIYCSEDIDAADPGYREPAVKSAFRQR